MSASSGVAESTRNILFLMDPLDSLALKKDSTLAMIRAAGQRGWSISYCEQQDLMLRGGVEQVQCRSLELLPPFAQTLSLDDHEGPWYRLGDLETLPLADFTVIMNRKDPPFDMEYIYTTYFLERAQDAGVLVVNDPRSVRDCNEKFFATAFPECCPPLVVSRNQDILAEFQKEQGGVVFKKLDGMGGKSIFRVLEGDANLKVILETLTESGQQQIMGQRYLPEIADGDKRILLIDGEPVPYALARVPMAGESRGNLAAGGTGVGRPLTERDQFIAAQVGPELKRRGLLFVGIDVIGDYLTEVNVTCPTCIRELDAQFSLDIAGTLFDQINARLDARAGTH